MRILLYEYVTGGGLFSHPELHPLLPEGHAMISALAADFAAIDGCQVNVLQDARLPAVAELCDISKVTAPGEDEQIIAEHSSRADHTVIIAPETDGLLARLALLIEQHGGRLLGPPIDVIELAADKHRTAEHLRRAGVPVPTGRLICAGEPLPTEFSYPAVLKPLDGCGSQAVRLIPTDSDAEAVGILTLQRRLEAFCAGLPVSVSFLCGPGIQYPLSPCRQHLSDDGLFTYSGGSLSVPSDLAQRATALARRAILALPEPCGYIGLDLVLGRMADGSRDYVIEINPRLTTSYVGLRAACRDNLAAAMLTAAAGEMPRLSFSDASIHFSADGRITRE